MEAGRSFEARAAQVLMLARDGVSFANVIQVSGTGLPLPLGFLCLWRPVLAEH